MLHVGSLRTALYNYLVARQTNGTFILRIEDTDQERSIGGAIENILASLHWAGIDPDEGVMLDHGERDQRGDYGPYIQSQRLSLYRDYAEKLIASGHAYYAFDTKEEIDALREEEQKKGNPSPKYDGATRTRMCKSLTLSPEETARKLESNEEYVIRLKVPAREVIDIRDLVRGAVSWKSMEVDDVVLLKSDGFPTYHLANVVDDHLMEIDLVLRGEEWLPSLPKHVLLYRAFGWEMPQFAHVPLLLNADKSKLSKRQGDVAVSDYISKGYLPEAILNFLALLGWNPGTSRAERSSAGLAPDKEQQLFSMEDLITQFSLDRVQKAGAVFDLQKLDWLQGQWMRRIPVQEFATRIRMVVADHYPDAASDAAFEKKAALIQERITFFHEAPDMMGYFYEDPSVPKELLANKKQKVTEEILPEILTALSETLNAIEDADWNEETLKEKLFALAAEKGWKNGQVLWPLRAALTGREYSPGAFEVAAILGKKATLHRLARATDTKE